MSRVIPLKRTLCALGSLFILAVLAGFFLVPAIIKSQAQTRLSALLGRTVTIGRVRLNPLAFSATIENFDIREADGAASFLGWDRVYVRANPFSVLRNYWVVSEVSVAGPHVHVALDAKGSPNFADILAKVAARTAAGPKPAGPQASRAIHVAHLEVTGARLAFEDHARQASFATTLGPLAFVLNDFRTANGPDSPYKFEAVSESGEKLAYSGYLSTDPIRSGGEFILEGLVLKKYSPYYADRLNADIADGTLSVRGKYAVNLGAAHPALAISDGQVTLHSFKLVDRRRGDSIAELPEVTVDGIAADALVLSASIKSIRVNGGRVAVKRDGHGNLDILGLMATPSPSASPAAASGKPMDRSKVAATVGELAVHDFAVSVEDQSLPRPARLGVKAVDLSVKSLSLVPGATFPLRLSFGALGGGMVSLGGTVGGFPLSATLDVSVDHLQLLPFSPYAEQFVNARLTKGSLSIQGHATFALAEGKSPAAGFMGDVTVDDFGLVDTVHVNDLAGFRSLSLAGLDAHAGEQLSVAVGRVGLVAPYLRVYVAADGSINLLSVLKAGGTPAASVNGPIAPLPKIRIGAIMIEAGDFRYTDLSVEPRVRMGIDSFTGKIGAISSERMAKADVDFAARVNGTAPVRISGQLDPLGTPRFVDLSVTFRSIDLLPLSPYSGRYAGYEIARGKVSLTIGAKLNDRAVDLTDQIVLDQFTFGAPVASPVATHLPVRLGVALLKDVNGKIEINVPVKGSLDNPDFRIRDQVLHTIVTLLTKAAVSPFSLLASAFGGGGDELGYDEFEPGRPTLSAADRGKLATIQKALAGRPALSLSIAGSYDRAADTFALKQEKLAGLVRHKIWEARHALDPTIAPPDRLVITPAEEAAMVKALFDARFPPGTAFGTPIPRRPAVTPPPRSPRPSLFRRIVNLVSLKALRERKAEKKQAVAAEAAYQDRKAAALAAGVPADEMQARLADAMKVTTDDLKELAAERASAVRDQLIEGQVSAERLFIVTPPTAAAWERGPRVFLELE